MNDDGTAYIIPTPPYVTVNIIGCRFVKIYKYIILYDRGVHTYRAFISLCLLHKTIITKSDTTVKIRNKRIPGDN
jgi:hypothetical protein